MIHRLAYFSLVPCLGEWTTVRYSFELGTIEKGLEQRLVRYRPILYVHVQAVWRPCGAAMGWALAKTIQSMALATHGPRAYFYALVTQLPISDLRSIVICVEVTIRSAFGGLGS